MPELAEVALFARDLNSATQSRKVIGLSFPNQNDWGKVIVPVGIQKKLSNLKGEYISFKSEGKALFLTPKGGGLPLIEFRLGMTGQFQLSPLLGKWKRHCFLEIKLEGITIRYADPRRFGRLVEPCQKELAIGGYRKGKGFWYATHPTPPNGFLNRPRISWLLGTGDLTGIGNYLANEALGQLNLSPFEPCKSEKEAIFLLRKCGEIANKSFKAGGNSFGSGYYNLNGIEGRFSESCKFYQNPKVPRYVFRGRPIFTYFKLTS